MVLGRWIIGVIAGVCIGIGSFVNADPLNSEKYTLFSGDINGDGCEDFYLKANAEFIILHGDIATPIKIPPISSDIKILRNTGSYGFCTHSYAVSTDSTVDTSTLNSGVYQYHTGDFNGDGLTDVLLQAPNNNTYNSLTLAGTVNGQLPAVMQVFPQAATSQVPDIGADTAVISISDFNNDGRDDIILTQQGYNDLVYLAATSGQFSQSSFQEIFPTQHDSSHTVGALGAQHEVGVDGSATYSIPVYAPPGAGGMQPGLALTYNSNGGNGLVGVGFDMAGLSAIHRCPTNLVRDGFIDGVDFDDNDQFCLDGQRLVAVNGEYGADGTEYRLEHDTTTKIISYGSEGTLMEAGNGWSTNNAHNPLKFTVWTPSGQIIEYGYNEQSRSSKNITFRNTCPTGFTPQGSQCRSIEPICYDDTLACYDQVGSGEYVLKYTYINPSYSTESRTYEWSANKIEDRFGNKVVFTYHNDDVNGEHRITRIDYSYDTTGTAHHSLRFSYQNRPDPSSGFYAGAAIRQTQRLTAIGSYVGNTEVRNLKLTYRREGLNSITGDSRLLSVQECAGAQCTPATLFGWDVGAAGFVATANSTSNINQGWEHALVMDVNGDGRDDLVRPQNNAWQVMLSNGKTLMPDVQTQPITGYEYAKVIRYNNDNKDDILFKGIDNKWHVYQAATTGTTTVTYTHNPVTQALLPEPVTVSMPSGPVFTDINTGITVHHADKVKVLDINGDGRVDLLYTYNNKNYIRLMEDSGFGVERSTNLGDTYHGYGLELDRVMTFDINGDGLTDLLEKSSAATGEWKIWLSDGTGQFTSLLTSFTTDGHQNSPRVLDFNADGLSDILLMYNNRWYVMLNTGGNFQAPFEAAPTNTSWQEALIYDYNSDGHSDILYHHSDNNWHVYLSDGVTFTDYNTHVSSQGHQYSPQAMDITGNGMLDLALAYGNQWHIRLRNGKRPDYLTEIHNGMGTVTRFDYAVMTDTTIQDFYDPGAEVSYPLSNVNNATYLVSKVEQSDGKGGYNENRYAYKGMLLHQRGLGNLGFQQMDVLSSDTGIKTSTIFSQDYAAHKQGALLQVKTVAPNGTVLSDTYNEWAANVLSTGASRHYQRYVTGTIVTKRDLNGAFLHKEVNDYTGYDNFGNVGGITSKVYDSNNTLLRTSVTSHQYTHNTSDWLLGLVTRITKNVTVPGEAAVIRKSVSGYDLSTGRKTQEQLLNPADDTVLYETLYGKDENGIVQVDSYGHNLAVTVNGPDFTSRTTKVAYDSTGRYVTSKTNALNHSASTTYYADTHINAGLPLTSTNANGLVTHYTYDNFGRKKVVTALWGTANAVSSTTTFSWCSSSHSACPSTAQGNAHTAEYFVQSEASDGSESRVYLDKLGRELRKAGRSLDGQWVYVDYEFDTRGRNSRVSEPYFAGATPHWTTIDTYDDLDRVLKSTDANNRTDEVIYNGLTVISRNNTQDSASLLTTNQQKTEVRDSLGNVIQVTDNAGKTLSYRYDSAGNMTAVDVMAAMPTDIVQGLTAEQAEAYTTTTIRYDILSRKIRMTDPDKGQWDYFYNGLGQLIAQRNARGEVTCQAYDSVGRMVKRIDRYQGTLPSGPGDNAQANQQCAGDSANPETAIWVYDTAPGAALGQLHTVSGQNGYQESFVYDAFGRSTQATKTVNGSSYVIDSTYDNLNRVQNVTYPGASHRLSIKNIYNSYGFLTQVQNAANSNNYYTLNAVDARGNVIEETFGNGVKTLKHYENATGYLNSIVSQTSGGSADIQDLAFTFDKIGNLNYREDLREGFREDSVYDSLNRLTAVDANFDVGGPNSETRTTQVTYDALGNIRSKTGVGDYKYGQMCASGFGPHAVCAITGVKNATYNYDANGNMLSGDGRTLEYTAFDKPSRITKGTHITDISYGPNRNRYFRKDTVNGKVSEFTYVGGLYEKVDFKDNGTTVNRTEERHYIGGFAVLTMENRNTQSAGTQVTRYLHKDHIGSVTTITDESGLIAEEFSFDPWGKRRAPSLAQLEALLGSWSTLSVYQKNNQTIDPLLLASNVTNKGFTGHEQLDPVGLIHMNGRVYDAELGRFVSADPFVGDATNLQSLNRYSYVENNPLSYTDPSGYFLKKLFKKIRPLVKGIFKEVKKSFKSIMRRLGRLFAKVPGLQQVVSATLSAFCGTAAAACYKLINAGLSASIAWANGAPIGEALKAGAIAYLGASLEIHFNGVPSSPFSNSTDPNDWIIHITNSTAAAAPKKEISESLTENGISFVSSWMFHYANKVATAEREDDGKQENAQKGGRRDLGIVGNRIRGQLNTDIGKDHFERYWLGEGDLKLTGAQFSDIAASVDGVTPITTKNMGDNVGKLFSFYSINEGYAEAYGSAWVVYDNKGTAIGFRDYYDFDAQDYGTRGGGSYGGYIGEAKTRAVGNANNWFNGGRAKSYHVYYH